MDSSDRSEDTQTIPQTISAEICAGGRWPIQRVVFVCAMLLLASAMIRVICFYQLRDNPVTYQHRWDQSDMNFYDRWAHDLAAGDWLQDKALHPLHGWHRDIAQLYFAQHPQQAKEGATAQTLWNEWYGQKRFHQEPLYPYLVAATYRVTGDDVRHVFFWQMVLGCATNLLIYLLARELMGEIPAIVAGVLALCYGPFLYYEMLLLREATLVFATVAVMYLTVIADRRNTWPLWFAVGAAVGIGLLLKTTLSLFFGCVLLAIIIRNRANLQRMALCIGVTCAGVAIALSPAIIRNLRVGVGPTELSSVGTITFINSNVFDASNTQFGFTFWSVDHTPEILAQSNGRFMPAFWMTVKTYPSFSGFAQTMGKKLWWLCNWFENPDNSNFYFYREMTPMLRWLPISYLMIGALAVLGIVVGIRRSSRWWPIYAMAATNVAVVLAFYVNSRMRIAIVPELIIFAGLSIEAISHWIQKRRWLPLGIAGVAIVAAVWVISRPIPYERPVLRADDYLVAYMNYTLPEIKKAQTAGDLDRAGRLIDEYLEHEPAEFATFDAMHHPMNVTDQAIVQIFAAAHVREAKLIGNLNTQAADYHMKRARDLMASAGKPMPF